MKTLGLVALLAVAPVVVLAMPVPVMENSKDVCCPDWYYNLSIGAEALYWKPCVSEYVYGEIASVNPSTVTELLSVTSDYSWGVRVFGTFADECNGNFVNLEWAYLQESSTGTRHAPSDESLSLVIFDPVRSGVSEEANQTKAKQTNRYNKISLKFGHRFCGSECAYLYGYVGGRWIDIYSHNKQRGSLIVPEDFQIQLKYDYDGGGLEAGIGAYAELFYGIGASIRIGGIAAIGEQKTRGTSLATQSLVYPDINLTLHTQTRCLGGMELRAGLCRTYECGCVWARAEIGYELDYYFDALRQFQTAAAFTDATFSSNFGLGGLYVGFTAGF